MPAGEARTGERLPFTPEAKKALELSLREALRIKHSYIGTEHLLLGLLRRDDRLAAEVFQVDGDLLRTRVSQLAAGVPGERNLRSPALHTALGRAQGEAGDSAVTTGQLLAAIAADADSQGAKVLARLGVVRARAGGRTARGARCRALATPPARRAGSKSGSAGARPPSRTRSWPTLLADFSPEQIRQLLRRGMTGSFPPEAAAG